MWKTLKEQIMKIIMIIIIMMMIANQRLKKKKIKSYTNTCTLPESWKKADEYKGGVDISNRWCSWQSSPKLGK